MYQTTTPQRQACLARTFAGRKIKTSLHLLFLLASFTMFLSARAQEQLVGLTSNGGPQGKGTLFSIGTNGANFSILQGFADWGQGPIGDLLLGMMVIFTE